MAGPKISRLWLVLLLAAFFVAGLVILPIPFTRDQGIYAYNAWRWLGDAVPYRDTFGHKGPLLYAVYAVALKVSGGAMWGVNLFDLFARTAAVFFCYLAAKEVARERAAIFSATLVALPLFGVFNSCWWNGQAETFMAPLFAASAWLCARRSGRYRLLALALAGLIAGEAVMLKPTAGLHAVFLLGWISLDRREGSSATYLYVFIAGLVAAVSAWVFYFAAKGAAPHVWELLVEFNFYHAGGPGGGGPLWPKLWTDFPRVFHLLPLLLIPFIVSLGDREGRAGAWFAAGWLLAGLAQVLVQGKFFPYHWLTVVPPMGMAAGIGLDYLAAKMESRGARSLARAVLIGVLTVLVAAYAWLYFLVGESYRTREYLMGKIELHDYYARFNVSDATGNGDFNLLASVAAAEFIRQNTANDATVLVFGYEPMVSYLAARPAPTRFQIDYPLTFTPGSEKAKAARDKWRAEFMADLKQTPPALVVIVDNDANPIEPLTSLIQAREFEEFWKWLSDNYQQSETIEDFIFYRPQQGGKN